MARDPVLTITQTQLLRYLAIEQALLHFLRLLADLGGTGKNVPLAQIQGEGGEVCALVSAAVVECRMALCMPRELA